MLVARVAMKYLYRQIPRHNPAQLVVPATLLPEGIYMDFPAELRLQPDGETLTPYPTLDLGNDYLGHGEAAAIRSKISNTIDLRPVFVRIFAGLLVAGGLFARRARSRIVLLGLFVSETNC